jgi:hypothetical protein
MRKLTTACSVLGFAAIVAAGCSTETKTVRQEEIRTVPAPAAVIERRTVVETVPDAPVVVEKHTTTVEPVTPAVIERKTTVIEER